MALAPSTKVTALIVDTWVSLKAVVNRRAVVGNLPLPTAFHGASTKVESILLAMFIRYVPFTFFFFVFNIVTLILINSL